SATKSAPPSHQLVQAPPSPTEKKDTDPYYDDHEDPVHSDDAFKADPHGKKGKYNNRNRNSNSNSSGRNNFKISLAALSPEDRRQLFREGLLDIFMKYILMPVYDFFHARTGHNGCRISGWIRFWFGVVFVYSRILVAVELDFLMDPVNGVMPYRVTKNDLEDYDWSLFKVFPESRLVLYLVFYGGLLSGIGLILGVLPRWSAVILFVTEHNMHDHNRILWDSEENMMRLWCFFLIFMPLDHVTIYDGFGGWCQRVKDMPFLLDKLDALERRVSAMTAACLRKCPPMIQTQCRRLKLDQDLEAGSSGATSDSSANSHRHHRRREQSTSWPMWPFRLFQIYMCLVYLGAGLCKFNSRTWTSGEALWWLPYDGAFGRFFPDFVTEYLFNRMGAVKFQTWTALAIENLCVITIWIPKLRWPTFLAVIALHIGIELALVMHAFEYLSVLGWVTFFVLPNDGEDTGKNGASSDKDVADEEADSLMLHSTGRDDVNGKVNKKGGIIRQMLAPSRRKVLIESLFVGSLIYLFVLDCLPRGDIEDALPEGVGRMVKRYLFPSGTTRRLEQKYADILGLHAGQWTVYRSVPPHTDYGLTAVIQYNDGREPTVWKEEDLYATNDLYSLYMRERTYWSGTFTYYLAKQYVDSHDGLPFLGNFAIYLARKYSGGHIKFRYALKGGGAIVTIGPKSPIKSVSLMAHEARGRSPPRDQEIGLWDPVPRTWVYTDTCNYMLKMDEFATTFRKKALYEYNENVGFDEESGCNELDDIDEELHLQHGSFRPKYAAKDADTPER
ncbi:MAG: hypothetical protein SGILL_006569, partial [Bacillariaceae sp.]